MVLKVLLLGHGSVSLDVRPRSESLLLNSAPWTKGASATTLDRVIYVPDGDYEFISRSEDTSKYVGTFAHEYVHVKQQIKWTWPLFAILYFLFPLPFLAPFRAWFECQAYAHQVVYYKATVDDCINALYSSLYFWPLPKFLVKALMYKAVRDISIIR